MDYPNLRAALDSSASTLQSLLKQLVPVNSGNLRDSIEVSASIDGTSIKLSISLADYWKYICSGSRVNKEPVPVDSILTLTPDILISRYQSLNGAIEAVQATLNEALKKDILNELNSK